MYTAKPAVYKWLCNLIWTSNTPENSLYSRFQAVKLTIYSTIKSHETRQRSFEVARMDTLTAEKQATYPSLLVAFGKWQDSSFKRQTVSLR